MHTNHAYFILGTVLFSVLQLAAALVAALSLERQGGVEIF